MNISESAQLARAASLKMAPLSSETKNNGILAMVDALRENADAIIAANQMDLENASGLPAPTLKRLTFNNDKLEGCVQGLLSLVKLPDPVGITQKATELDNGLELFKVSAPIGVIGIIFESRPDALVQISSLCLKSGNAVLMKGGSEALNTNRALADAIKQATEKAGIPANWLQLMETRDDVSQMLKMDECIDLIIPRGSNAFVKYIMQNTSIPVMGHAEGLCHTYIDKAADLEMAVRVTVDAKTQYVSVCNATETLLVHTDIAEIFLPRVVEALKAKNVRLKGCERTCRITPMELATDDDWDTEYLDYILSIKIVDSLEEAVAHINTHGSKHTEAIITEDKNAAKSFIATVDAADVFWNCSTRFADGFRFGLGAEVGIATGKIHARGPVGLEGLCTYKWILCGHGDIVADYASGTKSFTHQPLNKTINNILN